MLLAAGVFLLYAGRHLTFFYDEWNFILDRRGSSLSTYLAPHNGHPSLLPVAIYKALFATVGLRHYIAYRIVLTLLHLICAALLYVLAERRLGRWLALLPVALLLFLGSAFQPLLAPFNISYLGSVAGGLGALRLLDAPATAARRQSAARDAAAAVLLALALASSGIGIPFLLAVAVLLIATRSSWRRLWIVAAPAALFGLWYLGWGTSEPIGGVTSAPSYVAKAAAGAVGGIAGVNPYTVGAGLTIAAVIGLGAALVWRRSRTLTPLLLSAATGALSFWALAAIARADFADPTASRYVYIGAVFVLLIGAQAAAGARPNPAIIALSCVLAAVAIGLNVNNLRNGERGLRGADEAVRTALSAVQIAAPVVEPGFMPYPPAAPQITAGPYLAAVSQLGSPAYSLPELTRLPESQRSLADSVLIQAERLRLRAGRPCRQSRRPIVDLTLPPGGRLVLRAAVPGGVRLLVRRFGDEYLAVTGRVAAPGEAMVLALPADLAPGQPWHVRNPDPARYRPCA